MFLLARVFLPPVIFTRNTSLIRSGFLVSANTGFIRSIRHHLPDIGFAQGCLRNDHIFS